MQEFQPPTDPFGSLQPPNRRPPTAVGAETPMPEPRPRPQPNRRRERSRIDAALSMLTSVPIVFVQLIARRMRRVRR